MEIANEFRIALPPDEAYRLLLDLEQVAPCMPGAELGAEEEDGSRQVDVTVKLGPVKFVYGGTVRIAEQDAAARRAVMFGTARETRGQGTARATIAMTVSATDGSSSKVEATADIGLTGRAAQMGRGVVEDVAARMIAEMARCLEARVESREATEDAPAAAAASSDPARPVKGGGLLLSVLWARVTRLFGRRR